MVAIAAPSPLPAEPRRLLLKPSEAATVLALSPRKLWSLTNAGEIRCVRIGRSVRYALADLQSWIEASTSQQR